MDPEEIFEKGYVRLAPLAVLVKNGKASLDKADELIVSSDLKRATKGDLPTGMTLLNGLLDENSH